MGNTTSSLASLSKEEIATAVAALGAKYEPYADAVEDNGVDGEILASLDGDEELIEIFDELQITSTLHRKVLSKTLAHAKESSPQPQPQPQPQQQQETSTITDIPEFFEAAAVYDLNIETPDEEVKAFDQIVQEILAANPKAQFAAANLILEDAQHPISARGRKPDGSTYSDRRVAYLPHQDSVCYYLVHDPSKDILIKDLPEGNPFGPTYIGHVIKDNHGRRVGALCQVADLEDEVDTNKQIMLLRRLATITEETLEERRTLQARARSLKTQLSGYAADEIVLPGHGPIKPVTVAQVRDAPPNDYPSPEEVKASGRPRNSSTLPAFRRSLATEDDQEHLPPDLFDAVDAAGMPRPPIGKNDMERVAAVEALGLHRMDPDGPCADSLRNLTATAAEIFRMPLAQISYHNHAKEFAFCPFSSGLTEREKTQCEQFVDEILIKDSKGAPFLGQRGRGNAVCNYPILSKRTFVVHDLWEDEAFTMYNDMKFIRSYVGCPIIDSEGHVVAMLCLFDFKPRHDFDRAHELQAENIARIISQTIENWALRQDIQRLEEERRLFSQRIDADKRSPPTGEVSFVFTDVQSSTLLWEQNAAAMEEALKLHNAIMRKCCADACGYEITTEGDAFLLAFHDSVDAIEFSLRVQSELYRAPWPLALLELSEAADDPQNALRGLRVRMGIHHGPVTTSEHEVTGRIRYTGKTVRLTKSAEAMCHGGQIVLTVDAWRVASSLIESLGTPQVLDLGEHVLMTGACMNDGIISKRLLQLVPSEFSYDYSKGRRGLVPVEEQVEAENGEMTATVKGRQFPPPISKRKLSPSFHEAPYADGIVTIAFVYTQLETLRDEVADATLAILGKLLRPLLLNTNGYECKEDRGIWMLAFNASLTAVQFGLSLMTALHSASTFDDSVHRKGLVKVGIVKDSFRSMGPDPTTGRADYHGPVVNRAARVAAAAGAGEVYLGIATADPEALVAKLPSLGPSVSMQSKGIKTLKGVTEPMALYLCC